MDEFQKNTTGKQFLGAELVSSRKPSLSSLPVVFSWFSFSGFGQISKNTTSAQFQGAESEAANSDFCDWYLEFEKN